MPEESKESKAKKLAAARKKLKEYQQRGTASGASTTGSYTYADSANNSGHVSSNISERSESELQLNGSVNDIAHTESVNDMEATNVQQKEEHLPTENVNYFAMEQPLVELETNKADIAIKPATMPEETLPEPSHNINAIQVLITEKSQLTMEVNRFRTLCREKDLEMEELRVQHNNATKRVEELTQRLLDIQKQQEQQRLHNAELQHKLAQARAEQEDSTQHINELKQQLTVRDERLKQLDADFKEKSNELEMSQLRIRQLSDESNITKDNRVESLTQTQFMYEQQIRDLQAMVQQLTQDKEQANTQYQTYVQQLNAQVQQLTERNNELMDESSKLQEREKQWVDHIQQMEKEIQKNISRQAEVKEEQEKLSSPDTASEQQLKSLQERLDEFDSERYEFQLKIKSQEDRFATLQQELKQKDIELEQLREHLENISSEQPDKTKLLATMESDKVAASRALSQNVELKKQLDELELRFVQLTNDKADLMTRLDSEQYANREMHTNYAAMEERLRTIDERFKFKDEEMIRLSHENEELKKKLENKKIYHYDENERDAVDHHDHEHDHHDHEHHDEHDHKHHDNHEDHDHRHHDHDHDQDHHHDHGEHNHDDHHHHHDKHDHIEEEHNHDHREHDCHDHKHDHDQHADHETCQEATEENITNLSQLQTPVSHKKPAKTAASSKTTPHIATEEAVEKLQQRFTQLMTQCADLTEEKQRLEHLVMQLQSETETIGEYIALYQTQRRILKQREYEKAAQTAMLQAEREQMRERLTMLNNLVNSLGMELPQNQHLKQQINEALAQNVAIDDNVNSADSPNNINAIDSPQSSPEYHQITNAAATPTKDLNSPESQQILHKIQDIITEIKENTKELPTITHTVDHLNCCSGKFEVV